MLVAGAMGSRPPQPSSFAPTGPSRFQPPPPPQSSAGGSFTAKPPGGGTSTGAFSSVIGSREDRGLHKPFGEDCSTESAAAESFMRQFVECENDARRAFPYFCS